MTFQRQRRTQTLEYWRDEFALHKEDMESLFEAFVEDGEPRTLDELGIQVIARRCAKENEALSKKSAGGQIYQPQERFAVGEQVVFPHLDYAVGRVLAVRPGNNPRHGPFSVIKMQLDNADQPREFASEFAPDHPLCHTAPIADSSEDLLGPQQLYERYGVQVRSRLEQAIGQDEDVVRWDDRWFLRGLLPEVTPFHLNIAEAMIDEHGKPLTIGDLLEEVDLSTTAKAAVREYALGYALSHDSRFVMTGSPGHPTWYLSTLIPTGVQQIPTRLVPMYRARGSEWLNRELRDFVLELDDVADQTPSSVTPSALERISVFITYPYRREGALPLSTRALGLLTEKPSHRFMVTFVDQRNKETISGWMMPKDGYGVGLGDWYQRHGVPIGGIVDLQQGNDPFTFFISYEEGKRRGEWITEAKALNGRLTFGMQRKAYTCRYDKHLLIDEVSGIPLDNLWTSPGQETLSLFEHLTELFPELAKLSGQGLVHAKTLYSAVNLSRRSGAVPVFAELTRRACFDPVGDGNWVYDETLRGMTYATPDDMSRRPNSRRQDKIIDRVYQLHMDNSEGRNP